MNQQHTIRLPEPVKLIFPFNKILKITIILFKRKR